MVSSPLVRGHARVLTALLLAVALASGALACRRRAITAGPDSGVIGGSGGGLPAGTGGGSAGAGGNSTNDGGAGAGAGGSAFMGCGIPATSQLPRLTNQQYDRTVRDLLGVATVGALGGRPPSSVLAPDQSGDLTAKAWDGYVAAGEAIAAQVIADPVLRKRFMVCDPTGDGTACLHDTIVAFGRRAFRRPLTSDEIARFDRIVARRATITTTGAATEVAEVLLQTFLASPSFLQRAEIAETPDGQGRFVLSPYEVASRLSFMLWGSTPDPELDRAADAGQLATVEQLRAQATRMIRDERAHEVVAAFHRAYLGAGADAETERLVDTIAFRDDGAFEDLFTTVRGFVNKDTAPRYGLDPAGYGSTLEEVTLDASQRPGILTRVAFLSAYAHPDRTAPMLRGAFISKNILGLDVAGHAGSTPAVPDVIGVATNRARAEAQTAAQACDPCHGKYVNPPGFALEAYDAAGRWQTSEADTGAAIDTAAQVFIDGAPVAVRDPGDLMRKLAGSRDAQRTYAQRWVASGYGRDANAVDACVVDALAADIRKSGFPILDLLIELTQPDSFRLRAKEAP